MRLGEVSRLVDEYRGVDELEEHYRGELATLIREHDDPWWRRRYDPGHLTASAFVIHPSNPSVALVHHAKLNIWVQPGGHIETTDSSHEEAARREVTEECGLTHLATLGVLDLDVHVFPSRGDEPRHLHYDLRWAFRSESATLIVGDGALASRWVPISEALTMDESISRPARKLEPLARQ